MGGQRAAESWSDEVATDGTQVKCGYGKRTLYKELKKARSQEPTKRRLEPVWGIERELPRCGREGGGQAELGTDMGNHLKRSRVEKRRPSGAWNQYCEIESTAFSGCEAGKFTGFYRIAARCYRLLPHKSTQVVDFPHLAHARLFWGSHEITKAGKRRDIGQKRMGCGSRFAKILKYDNIRAFVNEAGWELSILVRDGEIATTESQ